VLKKGVNRKNGSVLMEEVDAIIVGTGQGGVPLATDLAGQGKRVVVFERGRLGGSCINRGCTPSKAFLGAAHAAGRARQSESLGVYCDVRVDFDQVMKRVRSIRDRFTEGVADRLDKAGLRLINAEASFTVEGRVHGGQQTFGAPLVVINTGSRANIPPIDGLAGTPYLTDDNFWELQKLPRVTAVIGSGYIGLELGQGLARLGSEVHIFGRGERILSAESADISATLSEALGRDGIQFHNNAAVERVAYNNGIFALQAAGKSWHADALLVAAGRTPNTDALKAEAAGIELDGKGYIRVSAQFETTRRGVYAIGEAGGQPAFTHVAWEDYRRLLDIINGGGRRRDDRVLGYAVFTDPQVGRAGLSLEQAQENGYRTATADMEVKNMSRGIEWGHEYGFYRIVADEDTGRLLGAELVGYEAAELVHVFIDAIEKGVTLDELGQWQHIHPTYAENLPSIARMAKG
jgi:dihydrolipoamide dehydrogenase